jgi:hypothetical protein
VTEERKFAILFAATILAARKLIDVKPNKPNMAKQFHDQQSSAPSWKRSGSRAGREEGVEVF